MGRNDIFDYLIWRLKKNLRGHKKIYTVGNEFCHGTFVKKEKYIHPKQKKERERITSCCVQIESRDNKYFELITARYWNHEFLDKTLTKSIEKRDAVFPDIYDTMIVHYDENNQRAQSTQMANKNHFKIIQKRRNGITLKEKLEINELDPSQNNVFADAKDRIYDTMIVHDINANDESAKFKIRSKRAMVHKPYTPKYSKPATANPNYKYNYNIDIKQRDANFIKASDRIKMINQRLQNINSTNY